MRGKSLEKFNSVLVGNLFNELLFYIPENELTKEFSTKLENIDTKDLFNRVFIMDKMQGPIKYKKDAIGKALMKSSMLEDSMYLLLKKKKKLEEQEFSFVFDNYFEQAEFCFYITNWFYEDLETNTNLKLRNEQLGLFRMQYQAYKKHFEKLIKHFYPKRDTLPIGNFDVKTTIKKYFPDLIKKDSVDKIDVNKNKRDSFTFRKFRSNTSGSSDVVSTKIEDVTIKKNQSIPKPTPQEIEEYLLKRVFGIQ